MLADSITIQSNNLPAKNTEIKIIDVPGQTVFKRKEEATSGTFEKQIDVSELTSGIYFVQVKSAGNISTQKIIIR